MKKQARLNTQLLEEVKKAFVPLPGGTDPATGGPPGGPDPNAMPPQGGMPPGMSPMDPSMMQGGGAPPMDPSMGGGAPPMDPSMMGGMPPEAGGMPPGAEGGMPPGAEGGDPMAQLAAAGIDPSMLAGGAEEKSIAFTPTEFIQLVAILTGKGGGGGGGEVPVEGKPEGGSAAPKPKKASTDDIMAAINNLTSQLGGGAPAPMPGGEGMVAQASWGPPSAETILAKQRTTQGVQDIVSLVSDAIKKGKGLFNKKKKKPTGLVMNAPPRNVPYTQPVVQSGMQKQQSVGDRIKYAYLKEAGFIEDMKAKGKEIWESPLKETARKTMEGGKKLVSKGVKKTKELYEKGKKVLHNKTGVTETKSAAQAFSEHLTLLKKNQ